MNYFILLFFCSLSSLIHASPSAIANLSEEAEQELGKKISEAFSRAAHAIQTAKYLGEKITEEYTRAVHAKELEKKIKDKYNEAVNDADKMARELGKKISDEINQVVYVQGGGRRVSIGSLQAGMLDKLRYSIAQEEFENVRNYALNSCECAKYSCGCCAHVEEADIHLNSTMCTNLTYLVDEYGVSFTITVNGYAIFNETISARNPPPICLGAPYVKELADVCIRLYDIDATAKYLHACVRIEARMKTVLIAKYELGCFQLGPPGISNNGTELDFVPSVMLV